MDVDLQLQQVIQTITLATLQTVVFWIIMDQILKMSKQSVLIVHEMEEEALEKQLQNDYDFMIQHSMLDSENPLDEVRRIMSEKS